MKSEIFDVNKFNVISDDNYYYVFRALNNADYQDIMQNITADSGNIQRIRTDRERWEETNNRKARFSSEDQISLEEIWLHIKKNYSKETNCISLSSNSNVSIDYGKGYSENYVMVKIPKKEDNKTVLAGQYMLEEVSKMLDEVIKQLPNNSEVLSIIRKIENEDSSNSLKEITNDILKGCRSSGKYTSTNIDFDRKVSIRDRFSRKQYFSTEQQLEYNKIIAKLTVLELYGKIKNLIPRTNDNTSLISTIGMAFSSGELIHYKDISNNEIVPISKEMMNVISLIQQVKELQNVSDDRINAFEKKVIAYIINNGNLNIDEKPFEIPGESLTIESAYELTKGKMGYKKAKVSMEFLTKLYESRRRAIIYANAINNLFNQNGEYDDIIDSMSTRSFIIDPNIITRENGKGIQISESVNIGLERTASKIVSNSEQISIINKLINYNNNFYNQVELYNFLEDVLDYDEEKNENTYFAELIIDSLDFSKIYTKAIKDKSLSEEERENILENLKKADCKKLFNAFVKAGISEDDVSGYIINILASNGYQGYSFEELSRLDDLDDIIRKNVKNTNLRGHVYPSTMEQIRGIKDNSNLIEDTLINLRDYQQKSVDNVDEIFEAGKRFAGVVLPTGAGKSFVAMSEMLKNRNGNILYIAPQQEILNQVQRHILKNIAKVEILTETEINVLKREQGTNDTRELKLPKGKILPTQASEYVKNAFPHLKMLCYQGLSTGKIDVLTSEQRKEVEEEERELKEILKNADANLIVLDELHRSGATTWKKVVTQLINSNEGANILGITATPIRDVDHVDMMREIAEITGTYTEEELSTKQYLGYEMYLIDAIQRGLVVEPKVVSFDFMLRETDEYEEIEEMISKTKDQDIKQRLIEIKEQMDEIIYGSDSKVLENTNRYMSAQDLSKIGEIINSTITKKDGRYIVFIPQHSGSDGLTEKEYFERQEQIVRQMIKEIDDEPEISYLSSSNSKAENYRAINNFENSDSNHLKLILAINMLNEGVHVNGINGEIMYRKINDGSTILYLQQLGRVIYSLDPDKKLSDEDLPIVYDIHNNYRVQHMNRVLNESTPKSDLQKLEEVVEWINKHGYEPDINSENKDEAKKAITLKKIQKKYEKYQDGINNPRLSKSDIFEIEKLMELAYSIDLFNKEIGERIIPPGEAELGSVQLFKITATQKKFLELYKIANEIKTSNKNKKSNGLSEKDDEYRKSTTARLNTIMNVLEVLNNNDIFIDNSFIKYNNNLEDIIKKCPEEIRVTIQEELFEFYKEYPIGQEYNFAKTTFRNSKNWAYFENYDIRRLYACGIFEDIDIEYLESFPEKKQSQNLSKAVLKNDFVVSGPKSFRGLNVKTGTYYNEDGEICEDIEFEKDVLTLRRIYDVLGAYSFANTSIDEVPDVTLEECVEKFGRNTKMSHVLLKHTPRNFSIRAAILRTRKFLENSNEKLTHSEIIKYKKLGILPLKINENGIDEDTKEKREKFGKSIEESKFKDQLRLIKSIQKNIIRRYSLANESLDEISDLPLKEGFDLYTLYCSDSYIDLKCNGCGYVPSIRQLIINLREYIEKENIQLSKEEVLEYKELGILQLNLDERGVDRETGYSRSFFGKSLKEIDNFDKKRELLDSISIHDSIEVFKRIEEHIKGGFSLANESLDELPDLDGRYLVMLYRTDVGKTHINVPYSFKIKKEINQIREYLQKNNVQLTPEELVQYKKIGVLPLIIDENGIDKETGLKKEFFTAFDINKRRSEVRAKEKEDEKERKREIREARRIEQKKEEAEKQKVKEANIRKQKKERIDNLEDILILIRESRKICTVNDSLTDLPRVDILSYLKENRRYILDPNLENKIPDKFNLRKEIEKARDYLRDYNVELTQEEIVKYKKLGILPLNLNEEGIDVDTNLPSSEFDFIDEMGFDRKRILL